MRYWLGGVKNSEPTRMVLSSHPITLTVSPAGRTTRTDTTYLCDVGVMEFRRLTPSTSVT